MRILASNPDTIGDMVLRQPLYRALRGAGHGLTLIVRPSVADVVPMVAGEGVPTLVLPREVYGGVDEHWAEFDALVAAAIDVRPDVLLVAPYHWTRFEEKLAEALRAAVPGVVVAGMSGSPFAGDPFAGPPPVSTLAFDRLAEVAEDLPEAEKNAALADMLGCPVASVDPVIEPDEPSMDEARRALAGLGLAAGDFALACVTGTQHVPIKAWPAERWAAVLKAWHQRHGRRFLFVGLPAERSVVDQVIAGMGEAAAAASAVWMEPGASVRTLAAMAKLSVGYVGHDTGPMHLAAAVGKPVLAVFGGGHKLRFLPRVTPSVSLSVRVPCAGCGWACSFDKAYCVQALTVDQVLAAADDLEAARATDRQARLHDLPADVHDHMTAFAADLARDRLRDAAALVRSRDALEVDLAASVHATESLAGHVEQLKERAEALTAEAAGLVRQVQDRERTIAELRQAVEEADRRTAVEAEARGRDVAGLKDQAELLRAEVEAMKLRLAQPRLAPLPTPAASPGGPAVSTAAAETVATPAVVPVVPRKTWRERVIDLVCGTRHYVPPAAPRPMPTILVVVRVGAGSPDDVVSRTIDSVLAEQYPHLELVIAAADVDRPAVAAYRDVVTRTLLAGERPFAAVAAAFADTRADLLSWLDVGTAYEPGALLRIGEHFRDHPRHMAAAFDQTDERDGWRRQSFRRRLDVETLRGGVGLTPGTHVVFRRRAYAALGPLKPDKGYAADWDLTIRFARRHGIAYGRGHSVCRFSFLGGSAGGDQGLADAAAAKEAFEASFGWPGRARCYAAWMIDDVAASFRRLFARNRRRWDGVELGRGGWAPPQGFAPAPSFPEETPVSPITHHRPDRLLFSGPDVTTGDPAIHRAYYDSAGDVAVAFPAVGGGTLERLYAKQATRARQPATPAADQDRSPWADFAGRPWWARALAKLPSPYWRLAGAKAGRQTVGGQLARLAASAVSPSNADARVLVVGCFDGAVLDEIKAVASWQLTGLETNAVAADAARAKGHHVVSCSPQDAFMTLPDGQMFDLILVPSMLEHWADPAWVLRRLTRLLTPAGTIVVRTPNLDSVLVDLFGPTWWHWQLPYHRSLFGRRGLRNLAAMCDLRVTKLRTVTDAYAAAASVQLNAVGLAGVVPDGAAFPPDVAAAGAKLAGWARLLWDRWGRGDELWATFRPI